MFLVFTPNRKQPRKKISVVDYFLFGAMLSIGVFMIMNIDRYLTRWPLVDPLTSLEVLVGIILSLVVLEGTRRTLGIGLTIIIGILFFYFFFGHHLAGMFYHPPYDIFYFIDNMIFTYEGIFGKIASVAATYVFFFVLFGSIYNKSGGGDFFYELASAITGKSAGGPAKVAVVSSAFYGSISGSPVSDVVTTGPLTIPAMRKSGFSKTYAGAVEAAASSGGSILPPVMGSAVFLMAEITGIPYSQIIIAAAIPALLYYVAVYIHVDLHAKKMGITGFSRDHIHSVWDVIKTKGQYFLPIIVLLLILTLGLTPIMAAIYAALAAFIVSYFKKETRMTLKTLVDVITETVVRIVPLVAVISAAGLIVGIIMLTGLGGKFSGIIGAASSGNIFISLMLTMVVCIIFGMGMPVPAAYVLTAMLASPILIELGVSLLQTHLFIVYFAVFSAITPPVAVAAFAAATIADENPMKIAFKACRIGIVAFIIPYLFIYQPSLMLEGTWVTIVLTVLTTLLGLYAVSVAFEGWFKRKIHLPSRLLFLFSGAFLLLPDWFKIIGVTLFVVVVFINIKNKHVNNNEEAMYYV